MSNSRKICVCGRERGKQPVVITITTCRKNHHPNGGDGSVCISSGPQATSSPIQVSDKPNTTNEQGQTQKDETTKDDPNSTENQLEEMHYDGSKTEYQSVVNEVVPDNDAAVETEAISQPSETPNETVDETLVETVDETLVENVDETVDETLVETVDETVDETVVETVDKTVDETLNETVGETVVKTVDETSIQQAEVSTESNRPVDSTTAPTDETPADNNRLYEPATNNSDDTEVLNINTAMFTSILAFNVANTGVNTMPLLDNQSVFNVAETGVNTMPFFDNLFWTKSMTKSSVSEQGLKNQEDVCYVELLVFEKHPIKCRHQSSRKEKCKHFFCDENYLFESIGRIAFPIPTTDGGVYPNSTQSEIGKAGDLLDDALISATKRRMELFENIEHYVKNKQYQKNVDKKLPPADPKLQKYITMTKDVDTKTSSICKIEEIFRKKDTVERGVQFRSTIFKNVIKDAKWYDNFLVCFGMKSDDNLYIHEEFPKPEVLQKNSSAYLISKYLRV